MNRLVGCAVALLAIAAACQAGATLADDYYWVSSGDQKPASPAQIEKSAAPAQAQPTVSPRDPAACGCEESCEPCNACCCQLGCEEGCKRFGITASVGLDSFYGVANEGMGNSNFGAVTALNAGVLLPGLEQYGLGWQTGVSYGVYNFDGRDWTDPASNSHSQQQIFVTTGFFRKAKCDGRLSFGLVYDWMLNDEWGDEASAPTLGQWRGQIEYALSGCNAIGAWGCKRDLSALHTYTSYMFDTAVLTNRAISQINLFWHHKFCYGADSYLWTGIPDHGRIDGDGSLLDWTVGASVQVPLSERLALYATGAYFRPSAAAGYLGAIEHGYDIGAGITLYFGGRARTHAINGNCADPYMPLANNSNFLVDQSIIFNPTAAAK